MDATRVGLPADGGWATVGAYLAYRLSGMSAEQVGSLFSEGRVLAGDGRPVAPDEAYAPGAILWVDRPLADEVVVPFALDVLYEDDRIVVLDKPHFLATMPRGRHVAQSALARARHTLGRADLAPAHRLDRLTAGVLVLTSDRRYRGAYQELFAGRRVTKTYLAVAPVRAGVTLPCTVRSHLRKERGRLQVDVVPDEDPNCATRVELLERRPGPSGDVGLYRLTPTGGRTHQLRRHLSDLGIPILDDPLYPTCVDVAPDDFSRPLQLLARQLAFVDPVDGRPREFVSRRTLAGWAGAAPPAPDVEG